MRLMVLWTTYGLCSFCRSSFSSVINFFFTAGNLREKKPQMRFCIKMCLHSSVRQVLNQHFHKKVPRLGVVTPREYGDNIQGARLLKYHPLALSSKMRTASLCPEMNPSSSTWSLAQIEPEMGFFSWSKFRRQFIMRAHLLTSSLLARGVIQPLKTAVSAACSCAVYDLYRHN